MGWYYDDINTSQGENETQKIPDSPESGNNFDETKKKVYQTLNLWYSQDEISHFMKKTVWSFDSNSLEWILVNNTQIQCFLNSALNDRQKDWSEINRIHQQKKSEEKADNVEEEGNIDDDTDEEDDFEDEYDEESWEDYSLRESSPEKFEQFLSSEEWINILKKEIDDHTDPNWNIYQSFPISNKNLLLKLKKAWFNSIREKYNKEYEIIADDDDKTNIKKYWELVAQGIDDLVWEFLKWWWDKEGNWILNQLGSLFNDKGGRFVLDMKEESIGMDNFIVSLKESIKKYANIIFLKENNWDGISLSTWETQLDLQFKLYLFVYGKLSYPNDFTGEWELVNYEENLVELLEAILHHDGQLETVKYNKYMEKERKLKEEREKRDAKRRKEIARRKKEINEKKQKEGWEKKDDIDWKKSSNSSNATWAEIAANANLWKDLEDYNLNIDESEHKTQRMKETAFNRAWDIFIQSHDNIKDIIVKWEMRTVFDINNGRIDKAKWETFSKNNFLLKWKTPGEIEEIYGTLLIFSQIFADAEEKLWGNAILMKKKVGECVKNYAIGAVIDNVREAFSVIIDEKSTKEKDWNFQWLQIDSVQKIWDKIVIAGSFNKSDVKVRYDLKTGKLFMNSLIHKDEVNPNKISIWDTSSISNPDSIDFPIGEIKPFNDVLNDYYKLPPHHSENSRNNKIHSERKFWKPTSEWEKHKRDEKTQIPVPIRPNIPRKDNIQEKENAEKILHSQINLISKEVKKNTEAQAQKNSTIINFMTTFNIITDKKNFNNLDFYKDSNLFEVIQIFDNSDPLDLEYFNNIFMPEIGKKYFWLKWWENNLMRQATKNEEKVAEILDYNGKDSMIMWLKDNIKNFNPNQFSWKNKFDAPHQLWFVNLIKQFLLNDSAQPQINKEKMENFINYVETRNPDVELGNRLNDI